MKIWDDKEVKSLFFEVEQCKNAKKSLRFAFAAHAGKFKRKPNSVRNYYYHEVDNLLSDSKRCEKLGIDLEKHTKNHFENFDKVSEGELFEKIENMLAQGTSVRSACLKLSNGDLALMTRLQNKFQNMKRKVEQKKPDNIIQFQKQRALTDSEINSLFLGLVKLIKKNAFEEVADTNQLLKKAFKDLEQKTAENLQLKKTAEKLQEENRMLHSRLEKTKALENHLKERKLIEGRAKRV